MNKPRLYIDSSCFIDAISGANIEDGRDKEVDFLKRILKASEQGDLDVFTSGLTIAEVRYPRNGKVTEDVKRVIKSILSSGKIVSLVEPTIFISEDARDLKWKYDISGLGGADAIHLATAISQSCKEFITVEGKPIKQAEIIKSKLDIRVIKPSETIYLPDSYKQDNLLENTEEI